MYLFILTFFLLYGATHLYVFLKAKAAFAFSAGVALYIILFMLLMVLAPFIVRLSEKYGFESFARLMSYSGYIWLGVLFLFFSSSIVLDVYRLCAYLSGVIFNKNLSAVIPPARLSFFMPLVISICIATYGYFEALNIRPEKITIKTSKIPKEIETLRIVQISDVHLGLIVREERLKKILKEVESANPDILVSTGDLVDGQIDSMKGLAELLLKIKPKYGKFAITGNHEFYAGLSQALSFTEKAGFRILRNEGLTVAGLINIAGVDDPAGKPSGQYKEISERELLSGLPHEKSAIHGKGGKAVKAGSYGGGAKYFS